MRERRAGALAPSARGTSSSSSRSCVVVVGARPIDGVGQPALLAVRAARGHPDRADRAADDAGRHHRRDRPVGGQRARADLRGAGPAVGRPASPRCRCSSPVAWCWARCSARSTACSSPVFGLPSLAVTIGTLALYRGLAYVVLGDRAVADYPVAWTGNAIAPIPGTHDPVGGPRRRRRSRSCSACVLHATPIGRGLYAIGNNAEAAAFAGISRRPHQVLAVRRSPARWPPLAGVFWTLRFASARADNGTGLELVGRRRGPARRRLHLRRPRRPGRRARRGRSCSAPCATRCNWPTCRPTRSPSSPAPCSSSRSSGPNVAAMTRDGCAAADRDHAA